MSEGGERGRAREGERIVKSSKEGNKDKQRDKRK